MFQDENLSLLVAQKIPGWRPERYGYDGDCTQKCNAKKKRHGVTDRSSGRYSRFDPVHKSGSGLGFFPLWRLVFALAAGELRIFESGGLNSRTWQRFNACMMPTREHGQSA
jgi:hypothetical protein